MIYILMILHIFFIGQASADPWGKDADLCKQPSLKPLARTCQTPLLGGVGEAVIHFHQTVISPADGPRSHFIPSSSQYMLDAMRSYGFFRGFSMGCDRLMRENNEPWVYRTIINGNGDTLKWDPVP